MHLQLLNLLGGLAWDPQIRGFLIFVAVFVMLPGTIYLLLATNVGARMGFLLAVAGISGWLFVLGVTWAFYGQGIKGREPSWKVQEVVHSTTAAKTNLSEGTLKTLGDFPAKWKTLKEGDKVLGDAQSAADNFITKSGRKPKMGHEGPIIKEPTPAQLRFPAEFSESANYKVLGGFEKGGDNELFTFNKHKFFFRHSPHYVVVQLQAVIEPVLVDGEPPPAPKIDPTAPVINVIVLRDLGSIRFPQVMMSIGSLIIFLVTCHSLHRRDLQIMAAAKRRTGYRVRTKGQGQTHG